MCFGGGGSSGADEARRAEAERQRRIREATQAILAAFGDPARDEAITNYRSSVEQVNLDKLQRDREEAARKLKFGLARTGQLGGSTDIFKTGKLSERYNEGVLRASQIAEESAARLRAQDEQAKQSLIAQAQGGMDVALAQQQALRAAQENLSAIRDTAPVASLDNLFADIATAQIAAQQAAGQRRAMLGRDPLRDRYGSLVPGSRSYTGSVTRIG